VTNLRIGGNSGSPGPKWIDDPSSFAHGAAAFLTCPAGQVWFLRLNFPRRLAPLGIDS